MLLTGNISDSFTLLSTCRCSPIAELIIPTEVGFPEIAEKKSCLGKYVGA
jgi:hypothetical protein